MGKIRGKSKVRLQDAAEMPRQALIKILLGRRYQDVLKADNESKCTGLFRRASRTWDWEMRCVLDTSTINRAYVTLSRYTDASNPHIVTYLLFKATIIA